MDLDTYMIRESMKNVSLAKALGFTEGFVSKLRKKKANPNILNAFMIAVYCNHEVTILDLISEKALYEHLKKRGFSSVRIVDLARHYPAGLPDLKHR